MTEVARSPKHQQSSIRCHVPEDNIFLNHYRENSKCHVIWSCSFRYIQCPLLLEMCKLRSCNILWIAHSIKWLSAVSMSEVRFPAEAHNILFTIETIWIVGLSQSLIEWILGSIPDNKHPDRETDRSSPSSDEVKELGNSGTKECYIY
jgi:hypothetical protein